MKNMQEYKVNVHAEPIDGLSMDKYDFECQFYVFSDKVVIIKKEDMKQNEVNGTTKSPSDGIVDLGTVLTEHQDINGKINGDGTITKIVKVASMPS